jgi:ubiquinone/menaquinone biosynthesis C-methylase UbiE
MIKEGVELNASKAYKGLAMEGPIASWYAKITLKDLNRHKLMAERLSKKIASGGRVLEVAPGPGYFCIELAKMGDYEITGLDISKSFVEIARKNAAEADVKVDFRQGNASDMPFANETFDLTFCQAAFKNFTQPIKAIAEMYRVLRPHGTALIVDLRRDASHQEIDRHIKAMKMSSINELLTKWTFRLMLLKNAYTTAEMEAFVAQTPFGKCKIIDDGHAGIGFQVWLEK